MSNKHKKRETVRVKLHISPLYIDELGRIAREEGLSLSRLVNSAIAVSIRHPEELVRDARGVEQAWPLTRS